MKKILLLALTSMMLWACSPKNITTSIDDLDLTITNHKEGTNFSNYKTYAIPDSVFILTDDENKDTFALTSADKTILNEVNTQMQKYGYAKIEIADTATTPPDVVLNVARLIVTQEGTGYIPGYCGGGWGGGWGYPGYGYCYPGTAYDYDYSTGTVMVSMASFADFQLKKNIPVLWTMASNGYISDDTYVANTSRIRTNIARGFEQSPYLQTK